MKNLLLLFLISFTLFACEKNEIEKEQILNIELRGAFVVKYTPNLDGTFNTVTSDELSYSLEVLINDEAQAFEINTILESGFVGVIYENSIKVKETDNVVLKIKDNNYRSGSHIYMNAYYNSFDVKKLEFEEVGEFHVQ